MYLNLSHTTNNLSSIILDISGVTHVLDPPAQFVIVQSITTEVSGTLYRDVRVRISIQSFAANLFNFILPDLQSRASECISIFINPFYCRFRADLDKR